MGEGPIFSPGQKASISVNRCTPEAYDEMIRANKLTQLEGPRNVGKFGESGDFGEISLRLLTK